MQFLKCLNSRNNRRNTDENMATCPVIAVIGSTGYVGLNCLMPVFLDALKSEKVKEVRVLTSEDKIQNCGRIKYFVNNGAKVSWKAEIVIRNILYF